MQRDRDNWAAYNAGVDGRQCEGSVWFGALHHKLPSGGTIDVFKSWATRRRADPRQILLERRFKHPLISRSTIRAARALRPLQGHHGLYFSGQYTTGFDSQESAVYSAMKVAESLAPRSQTLASLRKRPGCTRTCRHFVRPLSFPRRRAGHFGWRELGGMVGLTDQLIEQLGALR